MEFADGMQQYGFLAMVGLAVGGLLFAVLFPYFAGTKQAEKRGGDRYCISLRHLRAFGDEDRGSFFGAPFFDGLM